MTDRCVGLCTITDTMRKLHYKLGLDLDILAIRFRLANGLGRSGPIKLKHCCSVVILHNLTSYIASLTKLCFLPQHLVKFIMSRNPLEPIENRHQQIKNERVKRALDFLESRVHSNKNGPTSKPKSILRANPNHHSNVTKEEPIRRTRINTNERPFQKDYTRKPYTSSLRNQNFDHVDTKFLNKPVSRVPPQERGGDRVSILDRLEMKEKQKSQEFRERSPIRQVPELNKVPLSPLLKNSGVLKSQRIQQNNLLSTSRKVTKPKKQSRVLGVLGSIGSKITNSLLRVDEIDDLIGRHNKRVNPNPVSTPLSTMTPRDKDPAKPQSLDPNEFYFLV